MSSLLGTNLEQEQKAEEKRGGEMLATRHEPVYHAAQGCQGKRSGLTASRLRGLFWACPVASQKTAGFFACLERMQGQRRHLSYAACMLLLCVLKGGRLIAAVMQPHGKDVG